MLVNRSVSAFVAAGVLATSWFAYVDQALASPQAEELPVRRALLIGIDNYISEEFPDLRGAVNDVEMMTDVLTTQLDFDPEDIVVLTDSAATRVSILKAFEKLIRQTKEQDIVYLHYSGHGSQVRDLNGDEDDARDETILPHDARTNGVADITDDELGEILRRLRAEVAVVVLDSCHSGTATRGAPTTRSVPADRRINLYAQPSNPTRKLVPLDVPERYLLLTGAASNQAALDGPIDGRFHGFFSFSLAEAIRTQGSRASATELHASVLRTLDRVSELFGGLPMPDPQFEAARSVLNRPLFPPIDNRNESNSAKTAALLAPTNPASGLAIEVRVIQRERFPKPGFGNANAARRMTGGAPGTTPREASPLLPQLRLRKPHQPRSLETSLVLEVIASADCYLTVVDVDPEGKIHLMFPNSDLREGFMPHGRIVGGRPIRIPDTLQDPNRAGFFWDVEPPTGIDTLQVFASTDLATAEALRGWIREISSSARADGDHASRGLEQIKQKLAEIRESDVFPSVKPDWNSAEIRIRIVE